MTEDFNFCENLTDFTAVKSMTKTQEKNHTMVIAQDTQLISINHESTMYFPPTFKRTGISVTDTLQ